MQDHYTFSCGTDSLLLSSTDAASASTPLPLLCFCYILYIHIGLFVSDQVLCPVKSLLAVYMACAIVFTHNINKTNAVVCVDITVSLIVLGAFAKYLVWTTLHSAVASKSSSAQRKLPPVARHTISPLPHLQIQLWIVFALTIFPLSSAQII